MQNTPISTETYLLLQMKTTIENEFNKMASFRESLNETYLEQRKNFAAINAQLHIIQTRLQTLESQDNPVPQQAWFLRQGLSHNTIVDSQRKLSNMKRRKSEDFSEYGGVSGSESVHRECLMEHLEAMVNDMDLNNTSILDDLLGEDCLTQDEASNIKERPSRKDQVRKLIVLMAKRSTNKFVKFLATIERKCHYPHIAQDIKRIYDTKIKEGRGSSCLICTIKRDVDINDVIDKLCKHKIVDVECLELVISHSTHSSRNQSSLWEVIFSKIDQATNRRNAITVLQNALYTKYERLSAALGTCQLLQLSSHVCSAADIKTFDPNMKVFSSSWRSYSGSTSSISDMSTTSDFKKSVQKLKLKQDASNSGQEDSKSSHNRGSKDLTTSDGNIESSQNGIRGQTLENTKTCDNVEVEYEDRTGGREFLTTHEDLRLAGIQNNAPNIPFCIAWLKSVDYTSPISDSDERNIKSLDSNKASGLIVEEIDEDQSAVSKDDILKQLTGDSNTFQNDSPLNNANMKDEDDENRCENGKNEYFTARSSSSDSGYSKQGEELLSSPDIKETEEDVTKPITSQKIPQHNRKQAMESANTDKADDQSGMVTIDCKSEEVVQSDVKNK